MQTNYQTTTSSASALATNKVLRNTYALLGLTMIPTVIGAMIGVNFVNFSFMATSPFISFIVFMAVAIGFQKAITANRNSALGVGLLFAFTFALGVFLSGLLNQALNLQNGKQLIGLAAAGTGLIMMTMAGIATTSKKDFTFMGNFLSIGFVLVIIAIVANIFLKIPALQLAISALIVLISSGFLLYEVSNIVKGGETNYVMATMSLYISLFNIFSNLLSLIMSFMGGDD